MSKEDDGLFLVTFLDENDEEVLVGVGQEADVSKIIDRHARQFVDRLKVEFDEQIKILTSRFENRFKEASARYRTMRQG